MTIKSSANKRTSLLNRMHNRTTSSASEKRRSAGGGSSGGDDGQQHDGENPKHHDGGGDAAGSDDGSEDEKDNRYLYFNLPLPDDMLEDGHPINEYPRNKIRTAKYTPLSFVPKNLWFQFHNIANIFFLFLIILGVRISFEPLPFAPTCPPSPDLTISFSVVLFHFRYRQPGTQRRPPYCHCRPYCCQGCYRGLPKNCSRQRAEQCTGAPTSRLEQCQRRRGQCLGVEEVQEGQLRLFRPHMARHPEHVVQEGSCRTPETENANRGR
jgi:hypothetical protein